MAGGVAHEVNNILMGIQGYISLMLLDTLPTDKNYSKLKAIETQINSGSDLTEQLLERATPFLSTESAELAEHLRRERHWHYPPDALREALLNALVHRDWTRPGEVELVRFGDRLTLTSPGAMQNSMTVAKMLAGQRSARNPILVEVMRDYGYVEARGMGVRRKIVPQVRTLAGRDAEFEATQDHVRLTLPAAAVPR